MLNKILETLEADLSELPEKNIITGLIKGSGIARSFIDAYGNFDDKTREKARDFYKKSMRVHKVYKCFPNPLAQINCVYNISANKLLKVGNNEVFKKFVEEIKNVVSKKYDEYNG